MSFLSPLIWRRRRGHYLHPRNWWTSRNLRRIQTTQVIETLPFDELLLTWFHKTIKDLDKLVDLDFTIQSSSDGTRIDIYLDTEVKSEEADLALGLAIPNVFTTRDGRLQWDIVINTPELSDLNQLKYALLHELGHCRDLEHPFVDLTMTRQGFNMETPMPPSQSCRIPLHPMGGLLTSLLLT